MFVADVSRSSKRLAECQSVRFQVYCNDRKFLSASDYPTGIEQDEFDEFATHLAISGSENEILGTARLVHASELGFPLQRYCAADLPAELLLRTGEVSRLAVLRAASQRYSQPTSPRHKTRDVALRLYQTIYAVAKQTGLTHLIAAMEPSLVRICGFFDIPWIPIGPEVDYGGLVRPYLLSLDQFDAVATPAAIQFRAESRMHLGGNQRYASTSLQAGVEVRNGSVCDRAGKARAA
jgi:N-acyl amino acid synthase of PEP-CTERM/exosortase system